MVTVKQRGASVIGASHVKNHIPNQDSFLCISQKKFSLSVVADGVGSHKYSHHGSKAICKAAQNVFLKLSNGKIKEEQIADEIVKVFQRNVFFPFKKQCATTCLLVALFYDGRLFVAQAGDGAIFINYNNRFKLFCDKTDDFSNQVSPINGNKPYSKWNTAKFTIDYNNCSKLAFMLATDGISEDILPDKREDFLDYLLNNTSDDKSIERVIKDWQTPNSIDDKTLVVMELKKDD